MKLKNENLLRRIYDSKLLSDSTVYYLAPKLKELLDWRIISISWGAQEYNKKYEIFKNSNLFLSYSYNQLFIQFNELLKEKNIKFSGKKIIDQFCPREKYYQYLKSIQIVGEKISNIETKAEGKYLSCAISSIISRYLFLEEINELSRELEYELPLGASSIVITAFKNLSRNKNFIAEKYCKTHFRTLEKARQQLL